MNLPDRTDYENRLARQLSRLSSRHRRELAKHLGYPVDVSNVPPSFWEKVRKENEAAFVAIFLIVFMQSARNHGLDQKRASAEAVAYAHGKASLVASKYVETSRNRIARLNGDTITSNRELQDRLVRVFGPIRSEEIAISETTDAITAGGEKGVDLTVGLDPDDIWWTKEDDRVCEICGPLHETKREVWSLLFPGGPKAHPRCRCRIEYARLGKAA